MDTWLSGLLAFELFRSASEDQAGHFSRNQVGLDEHALTLLLINGVVHLAASFQSLADQKRPRHRKKIAPEDSMKVLKFP